MAGACIVTVPESRRAHDRRWSPRFPLPIGRVSGDIDSIRLLNVSRQGMAIEVPVGTGLICGDSRQFTLSDGSHLVRVEGKVRWVRTDWRDRSFGEVDYIQVAGLAFERVLTPRPRGIWTRLEGTGAESVESGAGPMPAAEQGSAAQHRDAASGSANSSVRSLPESSPVSSRTISVTMPAPPKLVHPEDGVIVDTSSLEVICSVSMPEEIVSVSINGCKATIEGKQARASVGLESGPNRLTALIWRHSGLYRSYSLGQVTRKES